MIKTIRMLLLAYVAFGWIFPSYPKSGTAHIRDITDIIFSSDTGHEAVTLTSYISQGMDMGSGLRPTDLSQEGSSFLNTLRKEFGALKGVGEHREFAHWGMNGAVPKEFLDAMELAKPGSRERVIELWREFVATRREAVKQALNLSGPNADRAAQAVASMISDVHLLGDHTTAATKNLKTIDGILADYIKSLNRILGNNNGLSQKIMEEVKSLPKGLSNQARAARILEILKKHNAEMGRRLANAIGRMGYDGTIRMVDFQKVKSSTKRVRDTFKFGRGKQAFVKCNYREAKIGGRVVKVVDVPVVTRNGVMEAAEVVARRSPVENAAVRAAFAASRRPLIKSGAKAAANAGAKASALKGVGKKVKDVADATKEGNVAEFLKSPSGEGLVAGIVTFVIDEGIAIVEYSEGDLARDQFVQKTIFNTGKAGVMGCATMGIATATSGTGLPLWAVFGAQFVGCIVVEKAGEYIWAKVEKECGVLPGVTDDELLYTLPSCVRNRHLWVEDIDEKKMKKQRINNRNIFDDGAPTDFEQTGQSFY